MLCKMRAEDVAMRSLRVLDAVMASRVASSWCCGIRRRGQERRVQEWNDVRSAPGGPLGSQRRSVCTKMYTAGYRSRGAWNDRLRRSGRL